MSKITLEFRIYFELNNNNNNSTYKTCGIAKVFWEGNSINLNVYSREDEKINNLRFYLKELEQQVKFLKSRKK